MDWGSQFAMFMPHGMCLLWRPELMSLHIISDALIALSYFAIPLAILRFVRGRDDLERKHRALALLFAAFIALCGLTHVVSIIVLWVPIYIIEGWLKAATAIISVAAVAWLLALVPHALKLPSLKAMQDEIAAHLATMAELDAARATLAAQISRTEAELRVAEHNWHQSTALLTTVVEAVPAAIYAKDRFGRMLLANKSALEGLGKLWAEVEGKRDSDILSDRRQADFVMANDRRVLASGQIQEVEEFVNHPDKGPRVYLSTKVPFEDAATRITGIVGVSIDITERKQLAKELLYVSRRSAMGELATAIAHEINQPLASIAMYLDGSIALLANEKYDGLLMQPLVHASDQCHRAGEIIRRLRSFVSGGNEVKQLENLPALVDGACNLALLGSHESGLISSLVHDDPEICVLVDRVQIEQVVVNLVRNAIDALGDAENRMLRVETGYDVEGTAKVSVSDNGPGISAGMVGRLFEPFTSTKGVKGIGVGLSISRTIIESHGGKIWNELGAECGTTFCFTLPSRKRVISV